MLLVQFIYLSTGREVKHKAAGWPLLLLLQWEAVCPGATSCHAALLPNTLRAGLTPTPCGPPVAGLSSSRVWFDIDCLKPNTYDSAKLNEKERVTIREDMQIWRPELWKEVTVLGVFLVCHGWWCHYRQQQCSYYFWAGLIVQQTPRAMSTQFTKHPVALLLYTCFIIFFLKKWLQIERIIPDLWFTLDILLSLPFSFIHSFNVYRVFITLYLSKRLTCALPSRLSFTFHSEGPTFGQSDQKRFLKGCEIETETQRMKKVILATNKRMFQVEGQNLLRPGWLCKTV